MTTPTELVLEFVGSWARGGEAHREGIRARFAPDTVWENVGVSRTTGPDEAIAFMDRFDRRLGVSRISVDVLAAAAAGTSVLTERVDHFHATDDSVLASVRVMGIFEVRGETIVAWRDYVYARAFG